MTVEQLLRPYKGNHRAIQVRQAIAYKMLTLPTSLFNSGKSYTLTRQLRGHVGGINRIRFSEDGQIIVSGGTHRLILLRTFSSKNTDFRHGRAENLED